MTNDRIFSHQPVVSSMTDRSAALAKRIRACYDKIHKVLRAYEKERRAQYERTRICAGVQQQFAVKNIQISVFTGSLRPFCMSGQQCLTFPKRSNDPRCSLIDRKIGLFFTLIGNNGNMEGDHIWMTKDMTV